MPRTVIGTDKIICPVCNHYHNNIQEYFPELDDNKGKFDMECENKDCGYKFNVEYKTEITTRTRRI